MKAFRFKYLRPTTIARPARVFLLDTCATAVEQISYAISEPGDGGATGFARSGGRIALAPDGDECPLTDDVDAEIGGKTPRSATGCFAVSHR